MNAMDLVQDLRSDQFAAARRRVLRQLAEALVFEGMIPFEERVEDGRSMLRIPGLTEDGDAADYVCRGRRRLSFGRLRLAGRIVRDAGDGARREPESVSEFLADVARVLRLDPSEVARMADELERTVLNDTLARRRGTRAVLGASTLNELESGVIEGHPYHPCYKSRVGFDYVDNTRFGPEFGRPVRPLWLAAQASSTRCAASVAIDPETFVRDDLGEQAAVRFERLLAWQTDDPSAYVLLPVHPWQWREVVVPGFLDDLSSGRLVVLDEGDHDYQPRQSLRTLANVTDPRKASLKLALGVVATSTSRGLASHTVLNAPLVSDWLTGIAADDPYLSKELRTILLGEVLGVAYEGSPQLSTPPGMVACIWRESVHPKLDGDEGVVPFTALTGRDLEGAPLISGWIGRHGLEAWVRRLLEVAIPPVIHLLIVHGIALEAHAQNMLLVHRDGVPVRVALRDFHDGIRFSAAHLRDPERRPPLRDTPASHLAVNRASYLETDDLREVRDFVHDAFFFVNLSELAMLLDDAFGMPEQRFWSLARSVVEDYRTAVPEAGERFPLFDLFVPTIRVERLASRRLWPALPDYLHEVTNPLAGAGGGL